MKREPSRDDTALRASAEARLRANPSSHKPQAEVDARQLQHELQVHQIELEMQNEELRTARAELETGLERYTDLFDFAPVGYFNLNARGEIQLVNLTGAKLVGIERARLLGQRFESFVAAPDRRAFTDCHARVFVNQTRQTCEVALVSKERPPIFVRLEAMLSPDEKDCRVVVMDITERQRAEATLAGTSQTLVAVTEALAAYVERGDWKEAMGRLLRRALELTQSEYGFIGVVVGSTLRVLAHEGIVWDKILNRDFYEEALRSYEKVGYLEFTNFNNLFGRAITTGQVVIANTPDSDPRSGGRPTGHPPMRSFLGVPIFVGEQVQGLVALANRPGGYSEDEQRRIETLVQHAGGLCTSYRQRETALVLEQKRAKAEAALAQAEGNRRAVWRTSIDAIITMDESGNITDFNPAAEKIFGYRAADVIGHPMADKIIPPAMREGHRRGMAKFLATGQGPIMGRRIELSALRSDGTEFPVELTVVSVTGAERPTFLGTVRDITERKQAEEALRASEANMAAAQRISHFGSWELDLAHRDDTSDLPLRWSDEMFRIAGYEPGEVEITRELFYQRVHPEDREMLRQAVAKAIRERGPYAAVHRLIQPSGQERLLQQSAQIFFDEKSGQPLRIVGTTHDITEQRKAERERDRLFNLSLDMLTVASFEGMFVQVNPAWTEHLGWTAEELTSRPSLDFVHPEDREATQRTRAQIIQGQPVRGFENRYRCKDGAWRWLSWNVHAFVESRQVFGVARDITEQRQLAEQLAVERARLIAAQSVAKVGSWETDLATLSVSWSAETHRIFETDPATFHPTHQRFLDLVHPEDRALVDEAFVRSLSQGTSSAIEHRLRLPEGRVKFVEERWQVFQDQAGKPVRALGTCQDITERKAAEDKVRASEEQFRQLAESNILGLLFWDAQGDISDANDGFLQMVGYTREELASGQIDWRSMTPPEYLPADERALQEIAATGRCAPFEKEYFRKDGSRVAIMVGAAALDGAKDRGICYVVDISQQKQAVAALRVSEERFRTVAKATNDAIWDWNLTTNELWWNEGYEKLFGYSRAEVDPTLKSWTEHLHPEDSTRVTDGVHHVIEHGGEDWSDEYRFRCQDGRYSHVLDRGHVIRDAAGQPVRMIGGMTDLTKLKEHEIALSQSNRALQLLSRCNEALIRSETESGLLATICQIAVDIGGFRLAWVGYAHEDAAKTIEVQAHAGVEEGYLSKLCLSWAENEPSGRGPAGQVIRHGEPVVIPDLETDESFRPWLEAARARGFRGVIALPLTDQQRTFGVLVLYLPEARQPLPDEMHLLRELADDMAFGIVNIRTRLDRRRLHTAVAQVAASVSAATSSVFFEQLTRNMVAALGAKAGFVAQVLPGEPVTSRTIAVVVDDQVTANFDYLLQGTPCETLFTSDTCVIHEQVARQFPLSPTLAALGAEGFVGRRLDNASGAFIGQMVVMFREPLKDADFVASTLQIFAARAAAELERQETDTKLREQAALLDKAQDAILVRDLDHHITYWNSSAARLYGWTAPEVLGRSERELLYSEPGIFDQAVEKLIAQGEWTGGLRHQHKDGRRLDIEGRWTLVRDAAGQPRTVLAIHTDVTERRQHERMAQRSQRLESIGTLAGGIAHDLNNALAPVMMSVELLRMQYPAESQILDTILACTQRSADMVRQLLTFAKGAEGERVALQSARLVTELEKLMKGSFPKNIQLVVKCDPQLPMVLGDATQLHQVLLNLCVNARDAMPHGGTLTLAATCQEVDTTYANSVPEAKPGKYVALRVRDTGAGIPPEILDRIFDPFFTTKGPDKGTGLGLSTVMGIVKGHGGFLQVYSHPGQGSTFTAYLPAEAAGRNTEPVTKATEKFRGQGETILFVDDEAAVRRTARAVLQRLNFNPLIATDGADGLMQAAQHRTELRAIITDMHMPHLDGLAFVRALRRMLPDLPVMVASGRMEDAVADEFKKLGVTTRLDKPFAEAQLAAALKDLLAPK